MKKTSLIILTLICFQQKAFLQNAAYSKLQFTSKEKERISIDSIYHYKFNAFDSAGKSISYYVEKLPSWLKFNVHDHSISGKAVQPAQYMIHLLASTNDTIIHQRFMLTVFNKKTINILALGN